MTTTLIIRDLVLERELGHDAMSEVRGGSSDMVTGLVGSNMAAGMQPLQSLNDAFFPAAAADPSAAPATEMEKNVDHRGYTESYSQTYKVTYGE